MNDYSFFKKLDETPRYFGLYLDELVPSVFLFFMVLTFLHGGFILSVFLSVFICFLIRKIKKGQGGGWFLNVLYWHLPFNLFGFLRKTPASMNRHYIK